MKKYIAIEQDKGFFDFDLLVDNDCIRSAGGLNCEVFGISFDHGINCFLNKSVYDDLSAVMDSIVEEFDDLTDLKDRGWTRKEIAEYRYNHSYKDIISDYLYDERFRKYSPKMVKELKEFVENYGNDSIEDITEFLTITTGKDWTYKRYYGYRQGDVCCIIYCTECHSEDYMELIGNGAVGAATEFCISENLIETEDRDIDDIIDDTMDNCYGGIYLIDNDVWNEDIAKTKLAEYIGCTANELDVIVIDNSYTVTKHNYRVA